MGRIKRIITALVTLAAVLAFSVNAYAAPHAVTQQTLAAANATHKYYTGIPQNVVNLTEESLQSLATLIMSDPSYTTDLQRVQAAASFTAMFCNQSQYGSDATKYYRSPAGPFYAGIYTCAGSTRGLGRLLDYMGYDWVHVNENQNAHQWCVVNMDGQTGYADGMGGFAGYGSYPPSGSVLSDGRVIIY